MRSPRGWIRRHWWRPISRAKVQRDAVRADLAHQPKATVIDAAEDAMIDSFGDVGAVIEQARPDSLARLYRDLRLEVRYRHATDGGNAIATIGVANECVRGGTRTPVRRTPAGRGSCAHRSVRSVRHASPAAHRVKRSFVAGSNSRHSNSRQDSNLRSRLRRPVGLVIAATLWCPTWAFPHVPCLRRPPVTVVRSTRHSTRSVLSGGVRDSRARRCRGPPLRRAHSAIRTNRGKGPDLLSGSAMRAAPVVASRVAVAAEREAIPSDSHRRNALDAVRGRSWLW